VHDGASFHKNPIQGITALFKASPPPPWSSLYFSSLFSPYSSLLQSGKEPTSTTLLVRESRVKLLEGAIRFEPWNPETCHYLSQVLRQKSPLERKGTLRRQAIKEGEKALRLSPWNSAILGHLGVLYGERGGFERAPPLLKRAIELDPFQVYHYLNLARICRFAAGMSLDQGDEKRALFFLNEGVVVEALFERAEHRSLLPLD
jgi:tetratricopeptide (TPR) repeat protein